MVNNGYCYFSFVVPGDGAWCMGIFFLLGRGIMMKRLESFSFFIGYPSAYSRRETLLKRGRGYVANLTDFNLRPFVEKVCFRYRYVLPQTSSRPMFRVGGSNRDQAPLHGKVQIVPIGPVFALHPNKDCSMGP